MLRKTIRCLALGLACLGSTSIARVQAEPAQQTPADLEQGVPVTLDGQTFVVTEPLGPFSMEERAASAKVRLRLIADDPFYSPDLFHIDADSDPARVYYRDAVIGVVTSDDAAAIGETRVQYATQRLHAVREAIASYRARRQPAELARSLVLLAAATVALVVLLWAVRRLHRKLLARLDSGAAGEPALKVAQRMRLKPAKLADYEKRAARLLRAVVTVVLVLIYLQAAFALLPMTRGYALAVLSYLLTPLQIFWDGILVHVGDLFFIFVMLVATLYVIRLLRWLMTEAAAGNLALPGVTPEWAIPLYKILRLVVIAITAVMIYPYIPGSNSAAFKGISLFAGALFTLGASGTAANFIGGVVLIFMGVYRLGDVVKIGEVAGEVIETNLLLTRIRTPKNEVVSVPNSSVLGGLLINYSARARAEGLILHTSVTIGYDAPWRQVHELLLRAASRTQGVLAEPAPFVLQTALNDFYVAYEINVHTREAKKIQRMYSELHQNIQDSFNEAGVEIMSPHYSSLRDGNTVTIPDANKPADYRPKGFAVRVEPPEGAPGKREPRG